MKPLLRLATAMSAPAGGYKVELRNGVILSLRLRQKETGEITTEYRISARWKLPSPMKSLLDSVDRVFDYFKKERYLEMQMLDISCLVVSLSSPCWLKIVAGQLIRSVKLITAKQLMHIGIFSALLAILRCAATPPNQAADTIQIENQDIHLAEIIIRVNLLLKEELRREEHQPQNRPQGIFTAVARRAVALDRGAAAFVRSYDTQADEPTQKQLVTQHDPFGSFGHASGEDVDEDANEGATSFQEPPNGAALPVTPEGILRFEDLPSEDAFFAQGLGPDGSHRLLASGKALAINDREFLQRLLLTGRSDVTLRQAADMKFNQPGTKGISARKACQLSCIARLFKPFVERHPLLASLDDVEGSLHFRDFPEDDGAQDRMHNECMTAVRLTLHQVSEARVNWMLAGGVTAQPAQQGQARNGRVRDASEKALFQARGLIVKMCSKAAKTVIQNHAMCVQQHTHTGSAPPRCRTPNSLGGLLGLLRLRRQQL